MNIANDLFQALQCKYPYTVNITCLLEDLATQEGSKVNWVSICLILTNFISYIHALNYFVNIFNINVIKNLVINFQR